MGESNMLVSILAAAVSSGTPILFAALGELITETAGVMNIGVEGMMLVGAVAVPRKREDGQPAPRGAGALLACRLLALLHAFMCIALKVNQIVSGLA